MLKKKNTYILMYKNFEVFSFSVDFRRRRTTFLEKLEHFDKAPYGFNQSNIDLNKKLTIFLNTRQIPLQRRGYKEILKATHCRNALSLSFKGHGLSLSNHYWYKRSGENLSYDEINFFTNKWDDSFARALLKEDYVALSKANMNVPDVVTAGWGVKGWLYDPIKGPRLYKLGIHEGNQEEVLGEVLASRLAQKMFKKEEVLSYELETIYGKYASVSSPIIGINEDLIPLSSYLSFEMNILYRSIKVNKSAYNEFLSKLKKEGQEELVTFFIKLNCLKTICFVSDLHFENISMIKNMKSGEIRVAPIYDLGGAFGSSNTAKEHLIHPNKATLLLIYYLYYNLDPEWDYSWYNKDRLVGFEDEIKEVLRKSSFYTPEIMEFIIQIYHQQKETLDEMSDKNRN